MTDGRKVALHVGGGYVLRGTMSRGNGNRYTVCQYFVQQQSDWSPLLGSPLGLWRRLGKDRLPSGSQVGYGCIVGRRGDGSVSVDGSQKLLEALEGSAQQPEGFKFLDDGIRER